MEQTFTISVVVAIIILLLPYLLKKWHNKAHIAGIVLSLGITGTFVGVFIGLYNFNETDLAGSVPELLAGLKTAFITSIAGLLANILLRTAPSIYGFQKELSNDEANNVGRDLTAAIEKLTYSVSGDGETTLMTQLQKLRTTNYDGFTTMHSSFKEFADQMVADSTQSLIDALTKVMEDFNSKINEQFGENFKKLNEAVGAMVVWQDKHKEMVERQHLEYNSVVDDTHTKYREIFEEQGLLFKNQFDLHMEDVEKRNLNQLEIFKSQHLQQVQSITSLQLSMSEINTNFTDIQNQSSSFKTTSDKLYQTLNDFNIGVSKFAELGDKAGKSLPLIEDNLTSITKSTNDFVKNNLAELQNNYNNYAESQKQTLLRTKNEVESMISDNKDRIENLDKALESELNKALENLGSNLSSLSNQFVNDYKPLTQQLKRITEIAKGIQEN